MTPKKLGFIGCLFLIFSTSALSDPASDRQPWMDFDAATDVSISRLLSNQTKIIILDFSIEGCKPCKELGPILKEIEATRSGHVKVYSVDGDSNPMLMQRFGSNGFPYLVFIRNGQVLAKRKGYTQDNKAEIVDILDHLPDSGEAVGSFASGQTPLLMTCMQMKGILEPTYMNVMALEPNPTQSTLREASFAVHVLRGLSAILATKDRDSPKFERILNEFKEGFKKTRSPVKLSLGSLKNEPGLEITISLPRSVDAIMGRAYKVPTCLLRATETYANSSCDKALKTATDDLGKAVSEKFQQMTTQLRAELDKRVRASLPKECLDVLSKANSDSEEQARKLSGHATTKPALSTQGSVPGSSSR